MKKLFILPSAILLACSSIWFSSCQPEETLPYRAETLTLPETPFSYANPELPDHFLPTVEQGKLASLTDAGATLGRVLFYDKRLSVNNKIACASCHQQEHAFADPAALSTGFDGRKTSRNSLAIANTINQPSFFWDSRTEKIEDLVTQPIRNHIEMGMEDLGELEEKLASVEYYPDLFEKAFGTPEVRKEQIASAVAQFMNSMVSVDTKFDRMISGTEAPTEAEGRGNWIFFGNGRCYLCHSGPNLRGGAVSGGSFFGGSLENWANIGLDETYTDQGMGGANTGQNGVFKVPTLRNIALTAPYMHDGRFETLEEVIEHYNSGVQAHPIWIGG